MEIIHLIRQNLDLPGLNVLCQTCRFFHTLIIPYLYPHIAQNLPLQNLYRVIEGGKTDAFRKLMDVGLDLDKARRAAIVIRDTTWLVRMASSKGQLEIVRMLVEEYRMPVEHYTVLTGMAGLPDHRVGDFYKSPLMAAIVNGHREVARYLIAHGAEPDAEMDADGQAGLSICASRGLLDAMKFMVEELGCEVNRQDLDYCTALWYAADRGHLEVVKYLVKAGADPAIKDMAGQGPISCAASSGHDDVFQFLTEESVCPASFRGHNDE